MVLHEAVLAVVKPEDRAPVVPAAAPAGGRAVAVVRRVAPQHVHGQGLLLSFQPRLHAREDHHHLALQRRLDQVVGNIGVLADLLLHDEAAALALVSLDGGVAGEVLEGDTDLVVAPGHLLRHPLCS